ncbi:hypothetical protein [Pseudaestuariivita rosea]|uniref:hypothetical protein n=1 Tax=Pseudaestuariivita rosea TaxID=2763263 RepID=UPI001ABA3EEF|nr:hypothetical protein [Pseudaestuariivita rosea]
MTEETWWDHFDEDPFEKVGRIVTGPFGEDLTIQMSRINWAYLDWLEADQKGNIAKYLVDAELKRRPEDGCRHRWMEDCVRTTYLWREKNGLPRPGWCGAAHPAEFVDI